MDSFLYIYIYIYKLSFVYIYTVMAKNIGTLDKYDQKRLWKFICIVSPFDLLLTNPQKSNLSLDHKNLKWGEISLWNKCWCLYIYIYIYIYIYVCKCNRFLLACFRVGFESTICANQEAKSTCWPPLQTHTHTYIYIYIISVYFLFLLWVVFYNDIQSILWILEPEERNYHFSIVWPTF